MSFKFGFIIGCGYCPNEYRNLIEPYEITQAVIHGMKDDDGVWQLGMIDLTPRDAREAGWWLGGRTIACPDCFAKMKAGADKQRDSGNKAIIFEMPARIL